MWASGCIDREHVGAQSAKREMIEMRREKAQLRARLELQNSPRCCLVALFAGVHLDSSEVMEEGGNPMGKR
jgi:hypothetical protein